MQIYWDKKDRKIWLSQKNYLLKTLWQFNMQARQFLHIPIIYKLSSSMSPSNGAESMTMFQVSYVSAIKSLLYVMINLGGALKCY